MQPPTELPPACPECGALEVSIEPALDDEGLPTGLEVARCEGCGRVIAELPPPEPPPEAEPEEAAESLALPLEE